MKPDPKKRLAYKDGVVVDVETAEGLDIVGNYEFEHWAGPDVVAGAVFGLSPEQAKAVRDSVPRDGKAP